MAATAGHAARWSVASLLTGLATPSLVIFVVMVTVGGVGPATAAADILRRQFAEGHNLFLIAAIGLVPFVVLSFVAFLAARKQTPRQLACIVLGGLAGILALMVPAHISIWYTLYGPGHASSTAVIGFLFIPFACLVSLAIGLMAGWLFSRLPWFRQ